MARGITNDAEVPTEPVNRVAYLEDRLSRLKAQTIHEFSDTKLYREGAMGTVMSLIADTRASLNAQKARQEGVRECNGHHGVLGPAGAAGLTSRPACRTMGQRSTEDYYLD